MGERPLTLSGYDDAVELLLDRVGPHVRLAAPLGLGKPHGLINAIYRRVAADESLSLRLMTALSLTPPTPKNALEKRFLGPFLERHFGADFEPLAHVADQKRGVLPANVRIEEFYLQSGALMNVAVAQRDYVSLNYTHVARAVAERGANALVQLVAREPGGERLSLSSNPDLTFDLIDALAAEGRPPMLRIAVVHPDLPFLGGDAAVDPDFFDAVLGHPAPVPQLFGLVRQPVDDAEHAIGLHASTLVRDGGTLQIGIGALSDALCHGLRLRHTDNANYRKIIRALPCHEYGEEVRRRWGGLDPLPQGLFGASEMITDGFAHLVDAGVIRRTVVDDIELMRRDAGGHATVQDRARLEREGQWLHAAFFAGSKDFYRWLRDLDAERRARIAMTRVSRINELYGRHEELERLQRRDARFFNTCMMMTALGAAVSDALEDGRVVSGVGGQYNFVAMAHALDDGRSVLLLRATRDSGGRARPNIVWNYGHTTIPRHLRDIAISEYGIADLRGLGDEDCIKAMLSIADARFQDDLAERAKEAGKLSPDFRIPDGWRRNTAERLKEALAPFRASGALPDYPLGSDFSEVEKRLVRALGWLKPRGATRIGKLRLLGEAMRHGRSADHAALERMDLAAPHGLRERLLRRLVALALRRTA